MFYNVYLEGRTRKLRTSSGASAAKEIVLGSSVALRTYVPIFRGKGPKLQHAHKLPRTCFFLVLNLGEKGEPCELQSQIIMIPSPSLFIDWPVCLCILNHRLLTSPTLRCWLDVFISHSSSSSIPPDVRPTPKIIKEKPSD